jgi:hypothetical protein
MYINEFGRRENIPQEQDKKKKTFFFGIYNKAVSGNLCKSF